MPGPRVQASPGGVIPGQGHPIKPVTLLNFEDLRKEMHGVQEDSQLEENLGPEEVQGDHQEPGEEAQQVVGQGDQHEGVQDQVWVRGAGDDDNARYRQLLLYMEERRKEAQARLQEDGERKERAKQRKESYALLSASLEFLKKKEDKWRCRKIDECIRIREEEKKDRLAVCKEKKRRYGLRRLSKEENTRIKLRTEERMDIAKGKTNLWRKFGQGREDQDQDDMEEDEYKAWEDVRSLVMVLEEEEGAWIDGDIKIKNIKSESLH